MRFREWNGCSAFGMEMFRERNAVRSPVAVGSNWGWDYGVSVTRPLWLVPRKNPNPSSSD